MDAPLNYSAALEKIQLVSSWYSSRMFRARTVSDGHLAKTLMALQRQCIADQQALAAASEQEIEAVAQRYAHHYQQLKAFEAAGYTTGEDG